MDTSHWKLKGAAKPATTLGEEAVFNPHERPCGNDLFVKCELKADCFLPFAFRFSYQSHYSFLILIKKIGENFVRILRFVGNTLI